MLQILLLFSGSPVFSENKYFFEKKKNRIILYIHKSYYENKISEIKPKRNSRYYYYNIGLYFDKNDRFRKYKLIF